MTVADAGFSDRTISWATVLFPEPEPPATPTMRPRWPSFTNIRVREFAVHMDHRAE